MTNLFGRPHPQKHRRKSASRVFYRAVLFLALLASTAFVPSQIAAHSVQASQDEVEAAYLYNFGKFVRWPGNAPRNGLNICILGHDPFGPALDRIVAGEKIDGRPLTVTRITDTSGVKSCSILFIDSTEAPRLESDMSKIAALPIMTVSDMPDFLDRGGMVQFVLKNDRVRFEVNTNAASKCGLGFSSQLLKVALTVTGTSPAREAR